MNSTRVFRAHFWIAYCCVLVLSMHTCAARSQAPQSTPGSVAPVRTEGYTRVNGVPFTRGVHGDLLADMYLPAVSGPTAAVVYLHGGAWKGRDRTQLQTVVAALAQHGYAGMAIDYDTTDKGDRFPIALQESERAVAWLRENAAHYNVDPQRIAVAGSSAGGELAALVGLDQHPVAGANVQAVVVFNGVLDLGDTGPDAEDMVAPYLGGACAQQPVPCAAASPLKQVHAGAPPFFVGHGTADRVVPYYQALTFVRELQEQKVPVVPFTAKGAGHTYWSLDDWRSANIAAVVEFLHTYLSRTDSPGAGGA